MRQLQPSPRLVTVTMCLALLVLAMLTGPASAQYGGGGISLFATPTRVPTPETFDVFGQGCPAGSTVDISFVSVPGVIGSTTASAAGNYAVTALALPDGAQAGTDLDIRADCAGSVATTFITVVCPNGADPLADGTCEDGSDGIVGGIPPTTTTTTVAPTTTAAAPTTTAGGGGGSTQGTVPAGGTSGQPGPDSDPNLAFTGAAFTEVLVQAAITLFAAGSLLVLAARRRRKPTAA